MKCKRCGAKRLSFMSTGDKWFMVCNTCENVHGPYKNPDEAEKALEEPEKYMNEKDIFN